MFSSSIRFCCSCGSHERRRISIVVENKPLEERLRQLNLIKYPGNRRPKPGGSPRHDLQRVSPLQRGCEYSKAIDFHGPKILLRTIQTASIPLYCTGVSYGRLIKGWYKPTGEGPTPCNTASERSSSRGIWGKKLRQLNLFSVERRCLQADLILAFKVFNSEVGFAINPSYKVLQMRKWNVPHLTNCIRARQIFAV